MIGVIQGKVILVRRNRVVLFTKGGVGYNVYLPAHQLGKVRKDDELLLYTYSHIREDIFNLFGFATLEELQLFELLLTVSGIGPRTALMVIDQGVEKIKSAVRKANVTFFTSIPRLGKKNAQKIIIELKAKIGGLKELDLGGKEEKELADILSALDSMGISRFESIDVLKQLPDEVVTLEQKIKFVLKHLGQRKF